MLTKEERINHIQFIENDTKSKGEEIVSTITFFASIYSLKVNKDGKNKKVEYSSAENVLKGYRQINPKQ